MKKLFQASLKDMAVAVTPTLILVVAGVFLVRKYVDPAPPKHLVISTGDGEGDYEFYAEQYRDILQDSGIDLEIVPSKGAWENLRRLKDSQSNVEVGFVQDGLGSPDKAPGLSSLGSLYYEPIWIFYRGHKILTRFSELKGKRVAIGQMGGSTHTMSKKLLRASGVDENNTKFVEIPMSDGAKALQKGDVDAAVLLMPPDDPMVETLIKDKSLHLMSVDQSEAVTRQFPFLHHLVLPHGAFDLKNNLPEHDVDLVSPTATLLVRDSLHPALVYLLLKAMSQVNGDPGIFEQKGEFPNNKDYTFPLSDEAERYYKSGVPFWQRYLPFWLATIVNRFVLLVIPLIALIVPVAKMIPRIMNWRVKSRFYSCYGELKFLETQIKPEFAHERYEEYLAQLEKIEERVNHAKFPLEFSDHVYDLREHIHFVRERLERLLKLYPKIKTS